MLPIVSAQLLFSSEWNTTGISSTAFRDGTVWDGNGGSAGLVDSAASMGITNWPTTNAYRVTNQYNTLWKDLGVPSPGETRYFRYYLQVLYDDTHGAASVGNLEHGVETADAELGGGDGMNFYRIPRNDGTWWPGYREISTGYRYVADGLSLDKDRTYRLEWSLAYEETTYSVQVRIYDDTGALVATEDDFYQFLPLVLPSTRLGSENFTYTPIDHQWFRVGINGPSSNFPLEGDANDPLFAHGAVCIRNDTWCGAYEVPAPLPTGICEATGSGRCYYIDPVNGNDNNNGSFAAPWRTGNNTKSTIYAQYRPPGYVALQPGDVVYLMDGTHSTIINPGHDAGPTAGGSFVFYFRGVSGTETNPITLKAYPGHTPVIAPASQGTGVIIEYANHWRIENLTIRDAYASGLRLIGIDGFHASNLHIYDTDGLDNNNVAGIATNDLRNAVFDRLDMHDNFDRLAADTGGIGGENSANIVFFQGGNVTVRNSRFYHTRLNEQYQTCLKYKHGIPRNTDWFEVYNSTFENCRIYGLSTGSPNTHFHHNTIRNGAGIQVQNQGSATGQTANILIEYNTLYNTSGGLGLVPYTTPTADFPNTPANISYRNNLVYDLRPSYGGEHGILNIGTYMSDEVYQMTLPELIINDNCYYNPFVAPANTRFNFASATNFGPLGANYLRADWQALGFDTRSVFANPQFIDLPGADFRLQEGSPCTAMGAFPTAQPPAAVCGNGAVEAGEVCDDGSSNGACPASCSNSCTANNCSATPRVGDLNGDGFVNMLDVIQIVANFKRKQNYDTGADINEDGIVNVLDMVLLGREWGGGGGGGESEGGSLSGLFDIMPSGSDVIVYDDNFGGYGTLAARRAARNALAAGSSPYYFYDGPDPGEYREAEDFIISPGYDGSPYAYRIDVDFAQQIEPSMYAQVYHNSGQSWHFAPDDATLVVDMWLRFENGFSNMYWIKGLMMGHNYDRTQYGMNQFSSTLGWANILPQSNLMEINMHQEDGAADAPVNFRRWSDITDGEWHRHTMVYRRSSGTGVARDGLVHYYVDGEKVVDGSQWGLDNGWMEDRQPGVNADSTNPYPGNIGEKYSTATGDQALLGLSDDPVNSLIWPGIFRGLSATGGGTVDVGRIRVWYRE